MRNMEAARALNIKSSKKRKMETDVDEPPERLIHELLHFINYFFWGGGGGGADHQSAGGRGFEPRPDQVESAAFVIVPAKGYSLVFSDKDDKP